ncbi:MAG: flagellar motor switch phosphatase FliY [Bacillota bacterium]|nr:flagellar motor switch phosphatase FliY [Bacillota bacterium]
MNIVADGMLSQEEIDALLNDDVVLEELTDEEIDAMGEIGNISMGTSATTLYTLLSQKVTITTPRVEISTIKKIREDLNAPHILIKIEYTSGIEGMNLLVLKEEDVKIITDLMMGGDGTNISDELTDLHLSAISEAMNQMIGSSSTSLSEMLGDKIDISPPEAIKDSNEEVNYEEIGLESDEAVVVTSFDMKIGDLIDSEIMQIMPINVSKQLVKNLINREEEKEVIEEIDEPIEQEKNENENENEVVSVVDREPVRKEIPQDRKKINAQPLELNNFSDNQESKYYNNDIELIKEVPLEITVELGRTNKKISEILEVGEGTVIELNSVVGDALNILANGKVIAKGEVVVVDENYGVRITDIIKPEKIIERI